MKLAGWKFKVRFPDFLQVFYFILEETTSGDRNVYEIGTQENKYGLN